MARWANTQSEQLRLSQVSQQMPIGGFVALKLNNGTAIEGVVRRVFCGNNAGQGGWHYYGECKLEDTSGQRYVVDYLDIQSATPI